LKIHIGLNPSANLGGNVCKCNVRYFPPLTHHTENKDKEKEGGKHLKIKEGAGYVEFRFRGVLYYYASSSILLLESSLKSLLSEEFNGKNDGGGKWWMDIAKGSECLLKYDRSRRNGIALVLKFDDVVAGVAPPFGVFQGEEEVIGEVREQGKG